MIDFLQTAFETHASEQKFDDPLTSVLCDEFVEICRDFDQTQIQDSWSWRNVHLGRELAKQLVDEKGNLKRRPLSKAIQILEKNLFSLGPERHHDLARQRHLLKILHHFHDEKEFVYALKRISRPEGHQVADRLIRKTLFLSDTEKITDAHARIAALSALLTSLRQNVGSCFATAPAILIQQEQPLQFLADIAQLLGSGRLTRIYDGVEYAVPLSASWGVGDLFRPFNFASVALEELSFSPGLQAAFQAGGLIERKQSRHEKQKACEKLLKMVGTNDEPFLFLSPDQIVKHVLLSHFGISEEDVTHYRERPQTGMMAEMVARAPKGKTTACRQFILAYEEAKGAFKALTDHALLKAWEFTLASLAETKADFAKWNLYTSLGVQPEEPHGIGQSIHAKLQEQIGEINLEIEEHQSKYDHLFAQVKYLEGRMRRASTESEVGWMRAEYQMRRHEIDRSLNERDAAYERGQKLTHLFPFLINFYGEKIRDFFQEVYDAEMHDVSANPYDDSPAGFRLLYKHGRANTALWSMINTPAEYIQYLTSFFVSTEIEISQLPEMEGLEKDLAGLVTTIILTIKRPEFLESSFFRLAKAYQEPMIRDPLEHLDRIKRKPWSYISGGTMGTLVSCYYGRVQKPKEEARWIENENELLAFLIDTVRELPFKVQKIYQKEPGRSMLAFSPTHAFLCRPGLKVFREAWESDVYSYTWVRDHWMLPQHQFLEAQLLDERMMGYLVDAFLLFIPPGYRPVVKNALKNFPFSMRPKEFREHVVKTLSYEKWIGKKHLDLVAEEIDSLLYRCLPLFPEHQLSKRLEAVFQEIDPFLKEQVMSLFDEEAIGRYRILSSVDLRNIALGLLILTLGQTRSSIPYHQKITEAMQKIGYAYPEPILFADTNWVKNTFGFTVNPGTDQLEFWRFDDCGSEGRPITIWKQYLNGKSRQEWGLYVSPSDYGQF